MNAHKLAATLIEDGTLILKGLPFHAGDTVEIIILEQPKTDTQPQTSPSDYPLQGTVLRYDEPFKPAVSTEDWEAISATMTEWNSKADELAYRNL
ncbi:MAG: hypothetical protein IGS50_15695 [Synechococcales cyanobacterium C42_A2020_086]|nr:hypothetical protein [Synechococcales cyanobacterium C42_A2020_086]